MSDSDSDGYAVDWKDSRDRVNLNHDTITICPSEYVFEGWGCIPTNTKIEAGKRMKICTFWLPIVLQRDQSCPTTHWAVQIGLVDAMDEKDIGLKHLQRIEILEAILRALEKGSWNREQVKHIFMISNMFNLHSPEVLDDALHWLEQTGEPAIRERVNELGHEHTCLTALHLIFTEFGKYIQDMGGSFERTMKSLMARPANSHVKKSEEMKKKGNENFQKNLYEDAVKFYSKAIKYYPDNHLIYGNRALCYIRSKKYLKAVGDGKRATLIEPLWAKGHYRYCEALFSLGEFQKAIEANAFAQSLCKEGPEGIKDLEQQHSKFLAEIAELKDVDGERYKPIGNPNLSVKTPKAKNKRPDSRNRADAVESRPQSVQIGPETNGAQSSKVSDVNTDKQPDTQKNPVAVILPPGKIAQSGQTKGGAKDPKPPKSEVSAMNGRVEFGTKEKKKSKNRNNPPEDKKQNVAARSNALLCKDFRSLVRDAHTALVDLRSRNAVQAFGKALAMLEASSPQELELSTLDVLLLMYGRASALTEVGQPEELAEAQKLMEKIKSYEERTFQCLVYYAVGRVYLKENRFAVALEQFSDSLQMVKNQITPGKLTWPFTKEVVKETQTAYFREILESAIELCKFPPIPDAICRLEKCPGSLKAEIYLTDPDFKGFIQMCCCQRCIVEYHSTCWKMLKTTNFFEKTEKDFLQGPCFTPDCIGKICKIKIIGPTGLLKCQFEAAIPKPQAARKPKVNQKCTSTIKLKLKAEKTLKRKQHRKSFQADQQKASDEPLQPTSTQTEQKVWSLYRDRVLLQISQNMQLLQEEKAVPVSALMSSLKPWVELDSLRGNQVAERLRNWQQEPLDTLGRAVELLLERSNRVWARVLIQLLSGRLDVNPKLKKWACWLNDAGLNAAQSFLERHTQHLEELDLALLLSFGPLQEIIIANLDTKELYSSGAFTDYLKRAPPHDMRLFIWTLEEHRDEYPTCHTILDDYFDMMDGHCSVLKKSDESQNSSSIKDKNRSRKKKHRDQRGDYYFSGTGSATPIEEWDQEFFEDESLSFLHPDESFVVPRHLREQVADFEEQYNSTTHSSPYKRILDNHPDPAKENLYDYFAQILEEHGPLDAEDPLLVGEINFFPLDAKLKIQKAGSFESFLLESLRFIKMGKCIGLAKHAVCLQQAGHGAGLDDLDDIMDPDANDPCPDFQPTVFTGGYDNFSFAQNNVYGDLPNPYMFCPPSACGGTYTAGGTLPQWSNGDNHQEAPYFPFRVGSELDLWENVGEADVGDLEMDPSSGGAALLTAEKGISRKHAEVQTCPETMSSVAVNTEIHEHFETCQGDINKKEKSIEELEQQIDEMVNGCDKVDQKHREDIASLEEDIQKITVNIQVTNKELALFQQKLEEELRKDQREKKANQEELRSLKLEIEEMVGEHGSLARKIREKKAGYDAELNEFLELSNQSAAERMNLEEEVTRCKASFTSSTRRSRTAQLSVAESGRDQRFHGLYRELADARAFLTKLDEAVHRFPNQDLERSRITCSSNVQEIERKISIAETLYKEQVDQVKKGKRVAELPPCNVNNPPEPQGQQAAAAPSAAEAKAAPAQTQHKPPPRTPTPTLNTMFDRAMERLSNIFPDHTRSDLMRFVQELRSSSGGSLSSMALQDVVSGVSQLILDHQEKLASEATPPLPTSAWQPVGLQRPVHPSALNVEDPCIICHDDMTPDDICVLECRHSFHNQCIRSWLKNQSTCPTCRDHALLPDDFPALLGRRRKAP